MEQTLDQATRYSARCCNHPPTSALRVPLRLLLLILLLPPLAVLGQLRAEDLVLLLERRPLRVQLAAQVLDLLVRSLAHLPATSQANHRYR
jgi:hypothetical protein